MPTASDLAKFFTEAWSQLTVAPFPFIVVILIAWGVTKAFYYERVKVANDRRELAIEQKRIAEEEREKYRGVLASLQQTTSPQRSSIPKIYSAKWGMGGDDYRPVEILLQGYLNSSAFELSASVPFFGDPYKNEHKHLIVQFSRPGSTVVETRTFKEGDPIKFTE